MTRAADELYLGVDVGTTYTKIQIVDPDGNTVALSSRATPWERTAGVTILTPDRLLDEVLQHLEAVLSDHPAGRVVGIGLTGFGETGVPLGARGEVLAPGLPWYDLHGADQLDRLAVSLGLEAFTGSSGLPVNLKPSLFKFAWLAERYTPLSRWVRWVSIQEWLAFRLTGTIAGEASLASRTGLLDVVSGRQSEETSIWAGVPPTLLPERVGAGTSIGRVTNGPARIHGAHLTIAGLDHLVAAVGLGALDDADLVDSCGTGEAIIRHLPERPWNALNLVDAVNRELSVGRDVFPGRLQAMASVRSGIGMGRFLKLMGIQRDELPALDAAALAVVPRVDGPRVSNVWLDQAQLTNIDYEPDRAEVWRAVIEAVQERAAYLVHQLDVVAGIPARRRIMTGGGLTSRAVREIKRRYLGDYELPDISEATSLGAAHFARMAAGAIPPIRITGSSSDSAVDNAPDHPHHAPVDPADHLASVPGGREDQR
ncbi:FGGY family carbohydrate kinase [Micromonospora echinospora]|uniref:FGGY-family carbohydrate kinase n=1 Tax=Micromonospora echinospora TaxID=1877 RepID=UPI0033D5FE3F